MKRMGTRGFDRGLFCGIAGRGAVSPRKTGGKTINGEPQLALAA